MCFFNKLFDKLIICKITPCIVRLLEILPIVMGFGDALENQITAFDIYPSGC
jgi:hypothetical protein